MNPLELKDVSVKLGEKQILNDLSFELNEGQLVWLKGSNGAGKSTLLRTIVGLLPYTGDITIKGHLPTTQGAKAKSYFVSDSASLYEDLSVAEHFIFTSRAYGQLESEARMIDIFEAFDLAKNLTDNPNHFSRGMRQKVVLSMVLGLDLPLFLLDEPFNALDVDANDVLASLLEDKAAKGSSLLFSAHQSHLELDAKPVTLFNGALYDV